MGQNVNTETLSMSAPYFLFPIFMIYLWKKHIKKIDFIFMCLIGLSLISAIVLTQLKPSFSFYILVTRAWELLIGASVARYLSGSGGWIIGFTQKRRGFIASFGLILIALSVSTFDHNTPTPSYYTLLPVIGAALIILFADENNICGYFLSRKFIVYFGLISYSMYLWHQPFFAFSRSISGQTLSKDTAIWLVVATIIVSFLTRKYIEVPFRRSGFINLNKFILFSGSMSVFIIIFGLMGLNTGGYSSRFLNITPIMTQNSYDLQHVDKCFLLNKSAVSFTMEHCNDVHEGNKKILLVGDSHAASLYPGLKNYLALHYVDTVMTTAAFCLPLVEHFPSSNNKAANKRCEDINKQVIRNIKDGHYELIVVSSYMLQWGFINDWSWTYPEYYSDFMKAIKSVSENNKILVVGQFVVWPNGLDQVIYKEAVDRGIKDVQGFSQYSNSGLDFRIFDMDKKYKKDIHYLGLKYVSIIDNFCFENKCLRFVAQNNTTKLVTFDYGHLGLEASQYVAEHIVGPQVINLLQ